MAEIIEQENSETFADIVASERPIYSGHPAADESPTDENLAKKEEPTGEVEDKPTEEIEEKPEEETDVEPTPSQEPEITFKYKSHEEAEKGYQEAERLITERAEEAKQERERAEELQRQLNEVLLKKEKESIQPKDDILTKNQKRMQKLLKDINKVDPEDEQYDDKVALLWAEYGVEQQAYLDQRLQENLSAFEQKRIKEEEERIRKQQEHSQTVTTATNMAKESGLNMDENSADYKLFWTMAGRAKGAGIKEQTEWTINEVKAIKKELASPLLKAQSKAERAQKDNAVLERGGDKPSDKKASEAPMSLSEAFAQSIRRI